MTHSFCMHDITKELYNHKASQIKIFTNKLVNFETQTHYEFVLLILILNEPYH